MHNERVLAYGLLAGGVLYFVTRPGGFATTLPTSIDNFVNGLNLPSLTTTPAQQLLLANTPRNAPGNAPPVPPASAAGGAFPTSAILSGASSAGAAGIAGATGVISGGAAVATALTAGVAAGVALLAYGIIDKGWFRGGEEGITVNPERDTFLSQFANYDYKTDANNPPGFYGLALILSFLDPNGQRGLFNAVTAAKTDAQFKAAAAAVVSLVSGISADQVAQIQAQLASYRHAA